MNATVRSTMHLARRPTWLALGAIGLLAASCGGGSNDDAVERLIEQETGGSVDIDLSEGGVSFGSDDGSFTMDEDGNFTVVGPDGEVVAGNADQGSGGIDVNSGEGSFTIDEEGNFTAVGADGEIVTGNVDAGGEGIDVESDDGSSSFQTGSDIPDEWPADVPKPDGLAVDSGTTYVVDGMLTVTISGVLSSDLKTFTAGYAAALAAAGFEQTSFYEAPGTVSAFYEDGTWEVSLGGGDGGTGPFVTIAVSAAAG